jgi:hypothetical protein
LEASEEQLKNLAQQETEVNAEIENLKNELEKRLEATS